ncbi:DUF4179 domain-containing protein [Sporosarcina sp. NPDC096371]|uniref:DUF4179 domain-containing protein n=1 Tax=Sporosarcina sp. NPDC096371 TaxID=3364530 RepID=UPI0038077732
MGKEFPDVKETIEKIEVPYDKLDQTIDFAIKRGRAKRTRPKRKFSRIIGIASVVACVIISSAFVSPTAAKMLSSIPLLNSVFEFAGDRGLEIVSQRGLSKKINETAVDQHIGATIQEVFYDGTRLSISYVHDALGMLEELRLKVNGEEIDFGGGGTGGKLPTGQYVGILDIEPKKELPEAFHLSIGVGKIGEVKGEWNFDIAVEASEEKVITIEPMQTTAFKDTALTVKTVKIGPSAIKLSADIVSPFKRDIPNIESSLEKDGMLGLKILNDHGEASAYSIGSGTGGEEDGKSVSHMEYRFAPLEESTDFLTIIPYVNPLETKDYARIEQPLRLNELPITFDHGEVGKMIITDVQYEADKTLLYFHVESDFLYGGHLNINQIWLEDSAGNQLTSDKGYPERIAPHTYVKEFQFISESEPLTIVTFEQSTVEVVEEMLMKIPIPKD